MTSLNDGNLLKQKYEGHDRVYYCNGEAKKLLEENPIRALKYATEALKLSESLLLDGEKIKALSNMAWACYYSDNYNEAASNGLRLISLLSLENDKKMYSGILSLLGHVYRKTGNFDLSLEYYFEGLKLYENMEDKYNIALTYRFMAIVYTHIRHYEEALKYSFLSLNIFRGLKFEQRIATVMLTISDIYRELNDKENCISFSFSALEIYQKFCNNIGIAYCYINLADIFYKSNEIERTEEYYKKAYEICSNSNDKFGLVHIKYYLAKLNIRKNDLNDAEAYLKSGLDIAQEISSKYIVADFYKLYSDYYSLRGNYKRSLTYYKLYSSMREKMVSEKYGQIITHVRIEYDLYKKQKELELYKLKSEDLIKVNKELDKAYKTIKAQNRKLIDMSKKLKELSDIDELTQLHNRRWLKRKIEELKHSKLKDRLYFLVLCDIDDFKVINDKYGHHFGDNVLVEICGILRENLTTSDYLVRWGGEEILILINRESTDITDTLNRVRKAIENSRLCYYDEEVSITMTFGVSDFNPFSFDECVIEADKAMYFGKSNGKNCVVFKNNDSNCKYMVTSH